MRSLVLFFILILSTSSFVTHAKWFEKSFQTMGTEAKVQFWSDGSPSASLESNVERGVESNVEKNGTPESDNQAILLIQSVENEMARINQTMSPYISSSELSLINKNAFKAPVKVSEELFNLLVKAEKISQLSDGAFDISYASVGYQYHYRKQIKPSDKNITNKLNKINYQAIALNKEDKTVQFLMADMKIDLGGIAKGYAVKRCIELLKQAGIKHGLVSAGGDTALLGDKRGKPWLVGIKHPRAADKNAVHLPLQNEAISTSGDYERYFIEDGQRYHHILNPKTGKSAQELVSVSVIGPDPTQVDALSTTLFVLGLKPAMKLIDSLAGYEAIIIDKHQRLHFSKGLAH